MLDDLGVPCFWDAHISSARSAFLFLWFQRSPEVLGSQKSRPTLGCGLTPLVFIFRGDDLRDKPGYLRAQQRFHHIFILHYDTSLANLPVHHWRLHNYPKPWAATCTGRLISSLIIICDVGSSEPNRRPKRGTDQMKDKTPINQLVQLSFWADRRSLLRSPEVPGSQKSRPTLGCGLTPLGFIFRGDRG